MKIINPVITNTYATFARASTATFWNWDGTLQTATANTVRMNWDRETLDFRGALIEPERTNLLLNSSALSPQTRTVTPGAVYTLSFYGPGSIVLTGADNATVVGFSSTRRTEYTFTAASSTLTLNVLGVVQYAQLERGAQATSVIVTAGSTVTRAPDVITGTGLFYSTFAETSAAYSGATTFELGAVVTYGTRLYTSLQTANLAHTPDISPTWWEDTGPNNIFACLDNQISTASVGSFAGEIIVIKYPANVDALAALSIFVDSIHLIISDGYTKFNRVYKEGAPSNALVSGSAATILSGDGTGNIVTIAVRRDDSVPMLGEIICGTTHFVGVTQYGFRTSLIDYSKKDTNLDTGVTAFVVGHFTKRATAEVVVAKADYNRVVDLLQSVRATPTVFIATDDEDYTSGALIYGFPESFDIEIAYPKHSICSLQVQGLI